MSLTQSRRWRSHRTGPRGMNGKRQRPRGGMRKAMRHGSNPGLHRGAAHSAAQRAVGPNPADEVSDSDGESMPLPDSTVAYGALLGALTTSGSPAALRKTSAAPVGGKRLRDDAPMSGRATKHKRRSDAANGGGARRQSGTTKVMRPAAGGHQYHNSAQGDLGSDMVSAVVVPKTREQTNGGRQDQLPQEGAAAGAVDGGPPRANGNATRSGGGGWRLSLADNTIEVGQIRDRLQAADDAGDKTTTLDCFDAHFDRCTPHQGSRALLIKRAVMPVYHAHRPAHVSMLTLFAHDMHTPCRHECTQWGVLRRPDSAAHFDGCLPVRDVAELPQEGDEQFVIADTGEQQAAWPSAAWHVQGSPLLPVHLPACHMQTLPRPLHRIAAAARSCVMLEALNCVSIST